MNIDEYTLELTANTNDKTSLLRFDYCGNEMICITELKSTMGMRDEELQISVPRHTLKKFLEIIDES